MEWKWCRWIGLFIVLVGAMAVPAMTQAPEVSPVEPFKLGTFEINGEPRIGIVLRDSFVVDLAAANMDLERRFTTVRLPMPADMKELIAHYEYGVSRRIYEIINTIITENRITAIRRPQYIYELARTRALAPILYPGRVLNAAVNYYGHVSESSPPEEQQRAAEERRRDRGVPYLFLKPTIGAIIGNGDDIILPRGRSQIDWECEIGVVIGRAAKYVSASEAKDYIFGYTIQLDMSDRGGRSAPSQFNSDWLLAKGHDTFAPMGPVIVPKEFLADPMNITQKLWVNETLMQDGVSSDMIHNIYELVEYASSVLTLLPGDVIGAGSPAGTGMSRSVRPEQVFLKPGDRITATIEGIGTLRHTVREETDQP